MTEAQWLACDNPAQMLKLVRDGTSERRLRLFACACCRRIWYLLADERSRIGVEVAERLAEGLVPRDELEEVAGEASAVFYEASEKSDSLSNSGFHRMVAAAAAADALDERDQMLRTVTRATGAIGSQQATVDQEEVAQSALLRDIFGNPFRPVAFSSEWRTDTALSLARQMYDGRDFGAMPILADALQEAGCDNEDILNHCRGTNATHVRGCWVVDLVLGKE
jgi:hypothetical protein